jgi:thiol-disulfide isomerase/thioredoxin
VYTELTTKDAMKYIGGDKPVLVEFYSIHSSQCLDIAPEFSYASTLFTDVIFAGVNCGKEERLCRRFDALNSTPRILFFPPGSRRGRVYDGFLAAENITHFVTKSTGILPLPSPAIRLVDVNDQTWDKFQKTTPCGMVLFAPTHAHESRHLHPQFAHLSTIFFHERNVSIAFFECDRESEKCAEMNVLDQPEPPGLFPGDDSGQEERSPTRVVQIVNGKLSNYTGRKALPDFVDAVNRQCGTDRGPDGLLSDKAGTIPQANVLAKKFEKTDDKKPLIDQMKRIPGSEFYVKVMERYLEKGVDQIRKDAQSLKNNLERKNGAPPALDNMKKRYNVLMRFLPKPICTPKPTLTPPILPDQNEVIDDI